MPREALAGLSYGWGLVASLLVADADLAGQLVSHTLAVLKLVDVQRHVRLRWKLLHRHAQSLHSLWVATAEQAAALLAGVEPSTIRREVHRLGLGASLQLFQGHRSHHTALLPYTLADRDGLPAPVCPAAIVIIPRPLETSHTLGLPNSFESNTKSLSLDGPCIIP